MAWIVRQPVPAAIGESVSSWLWDLDATGIAEVPTASADATLVELVAGFATEDAARAAADALRAARHPGAGEPVVEPADPASWIDPHHRATLAVGGHQLELTVGGAFGDGGHATTRLALDLLETVLSGPGPGPGTWTGTPVGPTPVSVLDVGTGTGILALAARARGAGTVTAVENDPDALDAARTNIDAHPELGRAVTLTGTIPAGSRYDVVVANLVLGTQRLLAPAISGALASGGRLVITGVLADQQADIEALHPQLTTVDRRASGDWIGLVLTSGPTVAGPPPDRSP